jgi:preprotein translocase subunit SecE
MESTNTKYITVSFMCAAIMTGVVFAVLLETLAAVGTGGFGRLVQQDVVRVGMPVVIGFLTFVILQSTRSVTTWADEVVTEIRRVVWPSRKDTVAMTWVVCVMLIICGVIFGLLDVTWGAVIDWLLKQNLLGFMR